MRFPGIPTLRFMGGLLIGWALPASLLCCFPAGCRGPEPATIAVIPRTSGTTLWEPEHGGAETAASEFGIRIYWNAPTREDDIEGQIALVERVISGHYQGLILAPDHSLALITPVRRAMSRGLATVIIGSPLPIPPAEKLAYILNDEEEGGRIAARRIAELLHGHGSVAILGINADITGIMSRARSFEEFLGEHYPDVHIVVRRTGTFNVPHEQQVAEEVLTENSSLDAILALTSMSTRGVVSAIDNKRGSRIVKVVAFDPDSLGFDSPSLDSAIVQDTRRMGEEAVRAIHASLQQKPMPRILRFEPVLVTRENVNTPGIRELTSMDWRPGPHHWQWSTTP